MYIHIYVIEEWNKIPIGPNQKLVSSHNSCKKHIAHGTLHEPSCSNLDLIELGFQY
jgi:hypothetical protein